MDKKDCAITNNYYYNCCGGETAGNGNGNPIGTVISYMGTKVPKHYLACDGAVLNITDYPALSEHIKYEFGIVDYFGGDGTETFAVPDLRNEFLRGYRGKAELQLSGEVGRHQEPTEIPIIITRVDGNLCVYPDQDRKEGTMPINEDNRNPSEKGIHGHVVAPIESFTPSGNSALYSTRPTNMAVLYCIKYE